MSRTLRALLLIVTVWLMTGVEAMHHHGPGDLDLPAWATSGPLLVSSVSRAGPSLMDHAPAASADKGCPICEWENALCAAPPTRIAVVTVGYPVPRSQRARACALQVFLERARSRDPPLSV